MAVIEYIILFIIVILANCCASWLYSYFSKKGNNAATKEDIEEITRQIETVKNEITFVSQRKKDVIVERKLHLLNLLYYAEKIANGQNSLYLHVKNCSEYSSLYTLIDNINDASLELTHEYHILVAEYEDFEKEKAITSLINNYSLLALEIMTVAHNAAIKIRQAQNCFEKAEKDETVSDGYTQMALELNTKVISLVKEPLSHKKAANKAINQYIKWLRKLFGKGLNFEYNLAKPQTD